MDFKKKLATLVLFFLVGCGGGSSDGSNSTSQTTFDQKNSNSQIADIYLGDNTYVNIPMEDIDLNLTQTSLTLPQNYVSNVNYGSDVISFIRVFYDDLQGIVRFTHYFDYPDNTYIQKELGYDITQSKFVYINNIANGEMGPVVNIENFSTDGSLDGVWEGTCVHEAGQNENSSIPESNILAKIEISGNNIKTSMYNNCQKNQLFRTYAGKFESQILYDEFSKRKVIVIKDPETEIKHMAPKRFLISSDGKQIIRLFGVNTYTVHTKTN